MNYQKIIFIVGPTAVGKSDVAFTLAQNIGGEIISCDSMQIYKEIHVANNKPNQHILNSVPHHLVGILPIVPPQVRHAHIAGHYVLGDSHWHLNQASA